MSRLICRIPTPLPPLLAVACAESDPMRYIPQGERNLLQAEALVSQRRAVAVARLLEPTLPEVEIRFEPDTAAEEILLVAGGSAPR